MVPQTKGEPVVVSTATSIRAPTRRSRRSAKLRPAFREDGTVTAGNASGINDGASAPWSLVEAAAPSARA